MEEKKNKQIKEEKAKGGVRKMERVRGKKRNNANSTSCYYSTKLLVPRNGRKKLNIYN